MPKRKTEFIQGHYYHIFNRGAAQQSIFRREADYLRKELLKEVAEECEIAVIAYTLLPNHYHWLVRQDGLTTPQNWLVASLAVIANPLISPMGAVARCLKVLLNRAMWAMMPICVIFAVISMPTVRHTVRVSTGVVALFKYLGWLGRVRTTYWIGHLSTPTILTSATIRRRSVLI
ncbi:MAG: transposase [Caldilineaceae bacterium]